jgi:hypothetical protein
MANLQQLIDENKPIYVLNRTGRCTGGKTHPYALVIKTASGKNREIIIPATKYPFLLSGQVPSAALKDADDLFNACKRGGALEVLEPEQAMSLLQDPNAQKAIDAAVERLKRRGAPKEGHQVKEIQEGATSRRQVSRPPDPRTASPDEFVPAPMVSHQTVNPSVVQMCVDLARDSGLAQDVYLRLAGTPDGELTREDLGHIISNVDSSKTPRIVKWARAELAKLSGDDDNEDFEIPGEEEAAPVPRRRGRPRQ